MSAENSCEVCGRQEALYVCRRCGRRVCEACFNYTGWVCSNCLKTVQQSPTQSAAWFSPHNIPLLFMTGSLLIFIGVAFIFISALSGVGSVSGGGIILIGPIPIVFGAGPDFLTLLPIAVAITIMAVVLFLLFSRRSIL